MAALARENVVGAAGGRRVHGLDPRAPRHQGLEPGRLRESDALAAAENDQFGAEHFARLASLGAELVIFGSGRRIRFPQPAWLQPLMAQRTGVETMDTLAACRTYNILAGEGRQVIAALLIETEGTEG